MSESSRRISQHLLTLSEWPHTVGIEEHKKKRHESQRESFCLWLMATVEETFLAECRSEVGLYSHGWAPHCKHFERMRECSPTEMWRGAEHVGKFCFLAHSQSGISWVSESVLPRASSSAGPTATEEQRSINPWIHNLPITTLFHEWGQKLLQLKAIYFSNKLGCYSSTFKRRDEIFSCYEVLLIKLVCNIMPFGFFYSTHNFLTRRVHLRVKSTRAFARHFKRLFL